MSTDFSVAKMMGLDESRIEMRFKVILFLIYFEFKKIAFLNIIVKFPKF